MPLFGSNVSRKEMESLKIAMVNQTREISNLVAEVKLLKERLPEPLPTAVIVDDLLADYTPISETFPS